MGDLYRKGSHYVTCDRTGLKTRAENVVREYTGAYVRKDWSEPRHPQDFTRPRRREEGGQARPSRPDPLWQFNGPLTTTLAAAAAAGDHRIVVETSTRFFGGDRVLIMLSTGEQFDAFVLSVATGELVLRDSLPYGADLGALVTNYSAISAPDLG